jgi:hypothetical protein
VTPDSSCVLLRWLCTTSGDYVSLDSSCVLLHWMCSIGGGCVTPDSSCVLLWWLCTTGGDCVCLWTIAVCYYNGCVPLAVTVCH